MLNRSKLHLIIFIVAFLLSIGLLAKNVLFLFVFFFLGTYLYFRQVSVTKIISLGFLFVAIALISSNLRLGNSEYILIYSRMGNLEIPAILAWYNTYFAVNITHLDTYFTNGYTPTYGLSSMSLLTSLLLLKGPVQELLGNQIIHFNGLGGGVNVNSFLKTYLSDFGVMSSLVLVPLGYLVSHIYKLYMNRKGYFYMLLHCGLIYAVTFSVFGDFFNRLMVYIGIAFILLPIYLTKKLAQKDTRKVIYHEKS
ncbi:hypothetical protein BCT52_03775 [Vibrio breoganii]|nr:hypothetical protein BCT52_03775 [Vibrio breoganii]